MFWIIFDNQFNLDTSTAYLVVLGALGGHPRRLPLGLHLAASKAAGSRRAGHGVGGAAGPDCALRRAWGASVR